MVVSFGQGAVGGGMNHFSDSSSSSCLRVVRLLRIYVATKFNNIVVNVLIGH